MKPNILLIADRKDLKFLTALKKSTNWKIFWKIIDFRKILHYIKDIKTEIEKNKIDFVVYSRNDQVCDKMSIGKMTRKLRIGYTSISAIDDSQRLEQTINNFKDFLECRKKFNLNVGKMQKNNAKRNNGTFSIIFDCEQIGEGRYGLPRALELLNKYSIKATFFVTNIMKKVYPEILKNIKKQGHEVGIHGFWHEYLPDNLEEQTKHIGNISNDFGEKTAGANFVGRMNANSLQAMANNNFIYAMYPLINYYSFFCYPKFPTNPFRISLNKKKIWIAPIAVETYGRGWNSIKNMLDSAILQSLEENKHITILMHSFRDANLENIQVTERIFNYLIKKKMNGITVYDSVKSFEKNNAEIQDYDNIKAYLKKINLMSWMPQTSIDFAGFIPENKCLVRRIAKKLIPT